MNFVIVNYVYVRVCVCVCVCVYVSVNVHACLFFTGLLNLFILFLVVFVYFLQCCM